MYYEQELENRVTGLATLMVAVPGNQCLGTGIKWCCVQ